VVVWRRPILCRIRYYSLPVISIRDARFRFCIRAFRSTACPSPPCMIRRYLASLGGGIASGRRPAFTSGKSCYGGDYLSPGRNEATPQLKATEDVSFLPAASVQQDENQARYRCRWREPPGSPTSGVEVRNSAVLLSSRRGRAATNIGCH
jgi:hypothetical protein